MDVAIFNFDNQGFGCDHGQLLGKGLYMFDPPVVITGMLSTNCLINIIWIMGSLGKVYYD